MQTMSNALATLVATNAEVMASIAIQCALETLQDPELLRVTRDEYFTYLMPEGELYDKSVVPGSVPLLYTLSALKAASFLPPLSFIQHLNSGTPYSGGHFGCHLFTYEINELLNMYLVDLCTIFLNHI